MTATCDLTFAMLADPESAVRMSHFCLLLFLFFHSLLKYNLCFAFRQIDVACGKNGAVFGISSGKGYLLLHEIYVRFNVLKCFKISVFSYVTTAEFAVVLLLFLLRINIVNWSILYCKNGTCLLMQVC